VASLKILALLADGMRAPFGSTLRPVLQQVVGKCKEKRLVPEVQAVLQAAFTHCLNYDCVNDDVIEFVGSKKSPPHGKVHSVIRVDLILVVEATLCVVYVTLFTFCFDVGYVVLTSTCLSRVSCEWGLQVGLMETVARTCATLPDKVGTDCLKPLATMLVGETEDPDPKVREGAITALAAIGTLAKSRGRLAADGWKVVAGMETSLPKIYKRVQALMESGGAPAPATGKYCPKPKYVEYG
jgi:hypothetical protein